MTDVLPSIASCCLVPTAATLLVGQLSQRDAVVVRHVYTANPCRTRGLVAAETAFRT
jgi:hypothetical protein